MKTILYSTLIALLSAISTIALGEDRQDYYALREKPIDRREIMTDKRINGFDAPATNLHRAAADEEAEFIFDPEGEEKIFVMQLYSYNATGGSFAKAESLFSQVRFAADGETVYFKHLTESLGVETWVQGTIDGDTIRVVGGQPLAYYQGKYLIMFAPMLYNDSNGELEAQDEFKLVMKGDSLLCPTFSEGIFQGAAGYVYITDDKQGCLSLDLEHNMRDLKQKLVEAPTGIEPATYIFSYKNSRGSFFQRKANVIRQDNDLYMQISTAASNAYVKATLREETDNNLFIEAFQPITDSTYVFFYSICDPVVDPNTQEVEDFAPVTAECRLTLNSETGEITSTPGVMGVDFMDGLDICMNYVFDPALKPYAGDQPAQPITPRLALLDIADDTYFKFMSFYIPALDVDSNYINVDKMSYCIYINDSLYEFTHDKYTSIARPTTEISYFFDDHFDFWCYGEQHYVYLYESHIESVGVRSIYNVNGVKTYSDMAYYRVDAGDDNDSTLVNNDLSLTNWRVDNRMVKVGEKVVLTGNIRNNGRNEVKKFKLACTYNGNTESAVIEETLKSGAESTYNITVTHGIDEVTNNLPVKIEVSMVDADDELTANNDTTLYFSIYKESFTQGMLLVEEFTSENCGWCPYGAYRLEEAINEGNLADSTIWVCHHEGFAVDWLTIPQSTEYTSLYGGNTFAPAYMINRDVNFSDEDHPVTGIGEIEEVKSNLQRALQQPCFVKIDVSCGFIDCVDMENGLGIQVDVTPSESFAGQCTDPRVTLFIVEDSVKAKHQKTYDNHTITYHHNVIRDVLTATWGDSISAVEPTSLGFTYDIPATISNLNLKVVAFVHDYNDDINCRQVFNTAFVNSDDTFTSIEKTIANAPESGYYNLAGMRVKSNSKGLLLYRGKKILNK